MTTQTTFQQVFSHSQRVVRRILKADFEAPRRPLFHQLNILDILSANALQVGTFMYCYHNSPLPRFAAS